MLIVNLLSHAGMKLSFQIPCKFAGSVPGLLLASSRYRPNWQYWAMSPGSSSPARSRSRRSAVGVAAAVVLAPHVSAELELARWQSLDVHHEDVVDGTREVLATHAGAIAR